MIRIAHSLLVLLIGANLYAESPKNSSRFGQLILTQLVSAPFPHPARAEGYKYKNEFYPADKNYSDRTVAIFIPEKFKPTDSIDLVVHFHGWRNHVENVLSHYQLIEQFALSGRNAVLVVPQGPRDAPDSFGGKLEDENGFKNFVAEILNFLPKEKFPAKPQIGKIILSGHSGGYHVIAAILARGGLTDHIQEVWLFDALYGDTEKFVDWFQHGKRRFIDIYTEHGGTKSETEQLIANLRKNKTPLLVTSEASVDESDLKTNKLIFLLTELPHDSVPHAHKTFFEYLKTSCLDGKVSQILVSPVRENVPGKRLGLPIGDLFVPDYYKPQTNGLDVIFFFHGVAWCAEQNLYTSRKNAVLLSADQKTMTAVSARKLSLDDLSASVMHTLNSNGFSATAINRICVASFSGGYVAIRALLSDTNSFSKISDVVLADSLYAPRFKTATSKVDPTTMTPFFNYARQAADGKGNFLFSQLYPPEEKYRDNGTTLTASYLISALKVERKPGLTRNSRGMRILYQADKGNFHVLGYAGMVNQDHFEHFFGLSDLLQKTSLNSAAR